MLMCQHGAGGAVQERSTTDKDHRLQVQGPPPPHTHIHDTAELCRLYIAMYKALQYSTPKSTFDPKFNASSQLQYND